MAELYAAISGQAEGTLLKDLWAWMAEEKPIFNALSFSTDGIRLVPHSAPEDNIFSWRAGEAQLRNAGLELLLTDWTFGTEELSSYSCPAGKGEAIPTLSMHPDDAARLNLADRDRVALDLDKGEAVLELCIRSNMAPGVVIPPRHRQVKWRKLKQWPVFLPEAENELVAGYHTEYSGMRFGLFFLGEYVAMIVLGALATVFFLGGWHGPVLPSMVWFLGKTAVIVFVMVWIRATLPRLRYDQLMHLGWKVLMPAALLNIIITGAIILLIRV